MPSESPPSSSEALYRALRRTVFLVTGLVLLFWFLHAAMLAVLFALVTFILAMALNPPVAWLERHGLGRVWAALLVLLAAAAVAAGVAALVVPQLTEQSGVLADNAATYAQQLSDRRARLLDDAPALHRAVDGLAANDRALLGRAVPVLQGFLSRVGGYTLSLVGVVFLTLLLLSAVAYALAQPRPLLRAYVHLFPPPLRDRAEQAYHESARAVAGRLWSNVIVGAIEAVLTGVVLSLLGVPGALVWGALAFFAELVPQVSTYLMALPPLVVALAVDPLLALWVLLYYMALAQLAGNVLSPLVRASTMNAHPAVLLFSVLALGGVFGVPGALIATPLAGIAKAYYGAFFASLRPRDPEGERRIDRMLHGRADDEHERADDEGERADDEGERGGR